VLNIRQRIISLFFSSVLTKRNISHIYTFRYDISSDMNREGRRGEQTDVGLLCVHTTTQMSLSYYLIWTFNNVCAIWTRSAFACLMLQIGKEGCHGDRSIWLLTSKRERREDCVEIQDKKNVIVLSYLIL
jgi:hypothetical protein